MDRLQPSHPSSPHFSHSDLHAMDRLPPSHPSSPPSLTHLFIAPSLPFVRSPRKPTLSPSPPPARPQQLPLQDRFCNAIESLIDHLAPLTPKARKSDPFQQGNFVPVAFESPPQDCLVEGDGQLPEFLSGVYIRNGPNQRYTSGGEQHFFDGDGMLHAVSIKGGQATYCGRFIRTSRFVQEEGAGQALFPKVFASSSKGLAGIARFGLAIVRGVLGVIDFSRGIGLANTGLIFHHGILLALSEDDIPHAIRVESDGELVNLGKHTFGGESEWSFTSHPKIDPLTNELFAFGYNPFFAPYLSFFRVSMAGEKSEPVHVKLSEPSMMHDFGLTSKYVIFPDIQLVVRPLHILQWKSPIVCDRTKTPRFGVVPRYAVDDSAIRWFNMPGCNCFHFLNSWDEGDEVVLIVTIAERVDHVLLGDLQNLETVLSEVRVNLRENSVTQTEICAGNLEMGNINRQFQAVKNRFVYMGVPGQLPNLSGVVKVDIEKRKVIAKRTFGEGCYASEPFFVPAKTDGGAEDEGCALCFVHDERSCVSRLLVLDARSECLEVLASVRLPARVPYGFHGIFVSQEHLNQQTS